MRLSNMVEQDGAGSVIDSFAGDYQFLSNFYPAAVTYEGQRFPTVENAYQAAKSDDQDVRVQFLTCTPGKAKRLGRKIVMRPDWEAVKLSVMRELVQQKFQRHADLKELLLGTGDAQLVEGNHWNDVYWGQCGGVGENHLGKILMSVRDGL